jgi:hypothetical protein
LGRFQQALVWVWAGLSLVAIHARGHQLGLDQHVTNRLRFHAIPVAISVLYHARPHDYTAFQSLAMPFQIAGSLETLIERAREDAPPPGDPTYYWAADDRGMADYVIAAFALFGPHTQSLYSFYFVVFGTSVLLVLLDQSWHPVKSAALLFTLGAFYAGLSVIPLGNLTVAVFEPGSLYEPRIIELLAYVATLHLGLTAFLDQSWTWRRIAIVAGQAVIVAACYHARSSVGWEVLFVVAAGGGFWIYQRLSGWREPPWGVICLVSALVLVTAYQHFAFNPRYFREAGARTVWHNALMGLSANRMLAAKYELSINDAAAIHAVRSYMGGVNHPLLTPEWTDANILGSLGSHTEFNWSAYEQAARDLYWHIWRVDTGDMLRCYLFDKPMEMLTIVGRAIQGDPSPPPNAERLSFNPLAAGALAIVVPGLLIAGTSAASFQSALVAVLVLLGCSLAPGLLFYPVVHTMTGAFVTLALTLYSTIAGLLAAGARVGWARIGSGLAARQT